MDTSSWCYVDLGTEPCCDEIEDIPEEWQDFVLQEKESSEDTEEQEEVLAISVSVCKREKKWVVIICDELNGEESALVFENDDIIVALEEKFPGFKFSLGEWDTDCYNVAEIIIK